ncbi:unnamed protein product [Calypogeia fissa]
MATTLVTGSTSSTSGLIVPTAASRYCGCGLVGSKLSFPIPRTQRQRGGHGLLLVTSCQSEGGQNGNPGRPLLNAAAAAAAAAALSLSISLCGVDSALARPQGVNRPELLPKDFTTVIDVAGFLSPQQESRIAQSVASIEEETGFKLRVLAQNYPETPGLAVKNFWQVDDNTIVFVADPNMGNILNFNVGSSVDLNVPRSFWSRLAGKYGNIFYWREKGEDASIEAAVAAIGECLREPAGPYACAEIH